MSSKFNWIAGMNTDLPAKVLWDNFKEDFSKPMKGQTSALFGFVTAILVVCTFILAATLIHPPKTNVGNSDYTTNQKMTDLWVLDSDTVAEKELVMDTSRSHAQKHDEYQTVRNCMDDPNLSHWRILIKDSKHVDVCMIIDGVFGFRPMIKYGSSKIAEKWSETTAYIREEITCPEDLFAFATEHGWKVVPLVWDAVKLKWHQ
jgi:hypothetical protein